MGEGRFEERVYQPAQSSMAGFSLSFPDFLDIVPAGAVVVNAHGTILAMNAELLGQFGYEPGDLLGRPVEILVPEALRSRHADERPLSLVPGQIRTMGAGRSLHGRRRDGTVFPIAVGLQAVQAMDETLVLAVVSDRTDHVRAVTSEAHEKALGLELAHQEVVAREMAHRVKNLMATIAALISLSARSANTPKELEESLRGRVLALSSVIDLAIKKGPPHATPARLSIEDILRAVLSPFIWTEAESGRVSLQGPKLTVGQRASEVLALIFHELATNAIKYGALRQPDSLLSIDWRRSDEGLELTWREDVRPTDIPTPVHQGFGTILVSRLIELELGGRLERQASADCWLIRLSIPAASLELLLLDGPP
ncbi:HWE histidine kinase domain-containing protein [Devosia nitrariae]|uniref:Blue-light-activated histidine kinase n=1 Tax=Devosia nitrariae TaxID=2071872 RepID=A0ABQ5W9W8_9HYPH|nr:HWE histidine kinase domain-containing protein [Devosia nitrariae]GLQ56576.1 hypothetical protein GCM10010862_38350 [Devosia nitrariae]